MNVVATRPIRRGEMLNIADMMSSSLEQFMKTGSFTMMPFYPNNGAILDVVLKE